MTKYIVSVGKIEGVNFPNSIEEIACEIISYISMSEHHKSMLTASAESSSSCTWHLLQKTAIASLEIDRDTKRQWVNHFAKFYRQDEIVRATVSNAYNDILDAALKFDRMCKKSEVFKDFDIFDDFNLDNAFDRIENSSYCAISEVVQKIYKVDFFQHR
jgi:hypothetical protein